MNPGDFDTFDTTVYAPQFMKRSRQVNSRLAKREQTKVARQTFFLVVFSIVLVLAFIFVALPAVIRFAIDGTANLETNQTDTIPPQPPIVSAPPKAVAATEIEVTGYAEAGSTLQSVVNGSEGPSVEISEDDSFTLQVSLQEGENTLSFFAVDQAGNESTLSREYVVVSKVGDPTLVITEPEPGQVYETASKQTITVLGEADPKSRVYVNGRLLMTDPEGLFRGSQRLEEGENELTFRVVDVAGNEIEKKLTVEFRY
jgi:flagellar biogenesis protein FliO